MRHRQEVLNVLLAQHLQREGIVAEAELLVAMQQGREMPDVVANMRGLRMVIEGDFDDKPDVASTLLSQATARVHSGIAHVGLAVLYPATLRQDSLGAAPEALEHAHLSYAVVTESEVPGAFSGGTPHDLVGVLRRVHEDLGQDRALEDAVAVLDEAIERFAETLKLQPATAQRFAAALGIGAVGDSQTLSAVQQVAVRRIAALVLTNAMLFQELLSEHQSRVPSMAATRGEVDLVAAFTETWRMVVEEINYYPIFHIAREVVRSIAHSPGVSEALAGLTRAASRILAQRGALRHDLMGRIYHRLLTEAKHLGAYYTTVPAATLLLKLAFRPEAWPDRAWEDLPALADFTVADLACGTGTLLMAAAEAATDRYVHACYNAGRVPRMDDLHRVLLSEVLWGYDVLPSAVHLTASTLCMRDPEQMVEDLNLFSLPLGGPRSRLGSLDFISGESVNGDAALFSYVPDAMRQAGTGARQTPEITMPRLDLCVMNPPFTRSVGGNLLFGNLPASERAACQKRLAKLIKDHSLPANSTAGLGAPFIATAHPAIEDGGRLAVVLPRAILNGIAWGPTRELINRQYHLEYVIVSHEPGRWNFSENTNLSEAMLVARRRTKPEESERTVFVNLWRNPRKNYEALSVARQSDDPQALPLMPQAESARVIADPPVIYGHALAVDWETVAQGDWFCWCAFAQAELVRAFAYLRQGRLVFPRLDEVDLPLVPLRELATLGPDCRDVHDATELAPYVTPYEAFWNHKTEDVTCMRQWPNQGLLPLNKPKPGRHLRNLDELWRAGAGPLLVAERLRLNTARTMAIYVGRPVLSNVWWTVALRGMADTHEAYRVGRALAVWLNSTPGILMLLGHRTETAGAWGKLKKPTLAAMPLLDHRVLSHEQFDILTGAFDRLCEEPLSPLPEMDADPVRRDLDAAVSQALGLPDLTPIREALAREPVISQTTDRLLAHARGR